MSEEGFYVYDSYDSDQEKDAVAAHVAPPVLTVTTTHFLGPPTKIPLSADIHLLLDSERHSKSRYGNPSTRTEVSYLLSQLESGTKTWVCVAKKLTSILGCDYILCKLFKDECPGLFSTGTHKYVFTRLDEPLIMRPGYNARHHVQESSVEHGDFYDSRCSICFYPFADTVRTLVCSHSFCACCLLSYRMSKGTALDENVLCPMCRTTSPFGPEPTSRRERMVNELILAVQEARLLYICLFDGCDSAFNAADLRKHVDSCDHRQHICNRDKGCKGLLVGKERHHDERGCLEYVLKDRELKDRRIESLTWENKALKDSLYATVSGLETMRSTRRRRC